MHRPLPARAGVALTLILCGCAKSHVETSQTREPSSAQDASVPDAARAPSAPDAGSDAEIAECMGGLPLECCAPPELPLPLEALPACPQCEGAAHCVPRALLEGKTDMVSQLAACDESSLCVPDPILRSVGFYQPHSCRSLNDAEGRCLSECLPAVASQRDILPQADCGEHERCVPCFDPLHGDETGACGLTCDLGPSEPPRPLPHCCGDAGLCIPRGLLPEGEAARLARESCADEDALCAPRLLLSPEARPTPCRSLAGGEGRCLSTCLPEIAAQAAELPVDVCAASEVCVPCTDPLSGSDTGACSLHGDRPAEPPLVFAGCCDELGACVPEDLLGERYQGRLEREECDGAGELCVPRDFMNASFVPESCRSLADAEGRCIPACLLSEEERAAPLPQASCRAGELCAPCFNPLDGAGTGVCSLRGDSPQEEPVRFDTSCCGTSGLCIPAELAGAGGGPLPEDRCGDEHGEGWLCAPKRVVEDPSLADDPFKGCKLKLGFFSVGRGKCVPTCMIDAAGWVERLLSRGSCESGERCVPCSLGDVPGC